MYASSGAPSAAGSVYSKRFRLGANQINGGLGRGGDDLDASRRPSFENAVFGVLFTLRQVRANFLGFLHMDLGLRARFPQSPNSPPHHPHPPCSKENSETRIVIRWVLLKILLDGWQVFTTVIQPAQGWTIDDRGTPWRIVSVLGFGWVADLGYGAYVALLYGMVALLAANIGLCVWVAWCFKEQKFPVVWPIKVLRFFTSVFFQAFDIASLNLLQPRSRGGVGITCRLNGPQKPHKYLALFPSYSCAAMPHVVHAVVSGVSLLVFVTLALLTNMAEVEVNPKSRRPMALGHSGAEVSAFALKVLMTLVDVFLGWPKVAACVYLALSLAMTFQYMRWSPSLVGWVNHLKAACSIAIVWCSICLMLLVFHPGVKMAEKGDAFRRAMTIIMLAGIGPALLGGFAASVLLMRRAAAQSVAAISTAAAKNAPLQDIVVDLWTDPRDVEIAVRCCRVWVDRNVLDKDAVARAQLYLKAGLALFPGNAFVVLLQANFMIEVLGVAQSGMRQVEAARKLKPGIMSRFIIFVRMQQAQQKAAGTNAGGVVGSNMDLLGFVEYQRKQRMVVRLHREALTAMCNFWKALDAHNVSFTYLSKALAAIEVSVTRAQTAYHLVLETYGSNYRLVRLYGKFLETVKNDPWGALEYYTEADRLEQEKNDDGAGPLLPDGTPLSRMDELATAVLLISSVGEIQMANKQVHHLFGYKKAAGELDGKLINVLLAPQSNKRMIQCLVSLVEQSMTGLGQVAAEGPQTSTMAAVLGMHHERMAFPLRVSITKATGMGEDSTFIALLEPVHVSKDASYFWVAPNGVIAGCDPQFVANFGYLPHDVIGSHLGDFLVCAGDLQALRNHIASVSMASAIDRWDLEDQEEEEGAGNTARRQQQQQQPVGESVNILHNILAHTDRGGAAPCHVSHRFGHPLACEAAGRKLDLGDAVLYEVRICRACPDPFLMLVTDRKGAIKFASPQLTSILCPRGSNAPGGQLSDGDAFKDRTDSHHKGSGHGLAILSGVAAVHGLIGGYSLRDFLPHPWKDIHTKLLKDTSSSSSPPGASSRNLWSCTRPVGKGTSMELHDAHGTRFFMHVAVSSAEVVGEHLHIARMAHSNQEIATSERRLRLQVNSEGLITGVLGRALWEVVDGVEQQLLMRPGSSLGRVTGPGQGNAAAFSALLEKVIHAPGRSYRVAVVPPTPASGIGSAVSRANAELAAAQRAAQVRAAVMTIHIPLLSDDESEGPDGLPGGGSSAGDGGESGFATPSPQIGGSGDGTPAGGGAAAVAATSRDSAVTVDLWPVHSVSGVLELNSLGRITSILEEHTRPAGLLFGVATKSLVGQSLTALVPLPPGREEVGDLLSAGSRSKKSSLKQAAKDPVVKVGPVHILQAIHADGHPLQLAVQVVGKPRGGEQLTVLMRLHVTPMMPNGGGGGGKAGRGTDDGRLPLDSPLVLPAATARMTTATAAAAAKVPAPKAPVPKPPDKAQEKSTAAERLLARLESCDTPSIRDMEEFVTGRSMNARTASTSAAAAAAAAVAAGSPPGTASAVAAGGLSASASKVPDESSGGGGKNMTPPGTAHRAASGTALKPPLDIHRRLGSPRARPATPSTPVKSPAELLAVGGSDSANGAAFGSGGTGNGMAGGGQPAASLPPMPAALAGAGLELPLPGVVTTAGGGGGGGAAVRVASSRRDLVHREAGTPRIGSTSAATPAVTQTTTFTPMADDDSAIEGSAAAGYSANSKDEQSDDPDAVQPVSAGGGKNMQRIQEWVMTKGELYQNAKPKLERDDVNPLDAAAATKALDVDVDDDDEEGEGEEQTSQVTEERATTSRFASLRAPPPAVLSLAAGGGGGGGGGAVRTGSANIASWAAAAGLETTTRTPSFSSPPAVSGPPVGLFAPPQPAYPPLSGDFDDTASNGGQSVMSGNSGTSGGAEYKRGKRFRNLVKLMDSSEAEQVLRRFRVGALLTMAVLAAAHTVCFSFVVVSIKGQQQSMGQLVTAGRSQRYLHQVLVSLRAMDQILKGKTSTAFELYNNTSVDTLAQKVFDSAMQVKVWSKVNATTNEDVYVNMTLWDLATKVYTSSKDVYQNYREWNRTQVNISTTPSGQFLLKSGPELFNGFRKILDDLLYIAMRNTSQVNNLLLAFLVAEGCGVSVMAAAMLAYLLRKLALQRYTLYGTFLVIPVGLTRALSSQLANTTLLEEEEEDEEEDDGPHGDDDHDKSGISDVETNGGNDNRNHGGNDNRNHGLPSGSMRNRHATLAPSATINSRRRPSFQAAVLAAYAKAAASGETQHAARLPAAAAAAVPGGRSFSRVNSIQHRALVLRSSWGRFREGLMSRLYQCLPCLARRSQTVFPTSHGPGAAAVEHHHKRHLKLDSNDTTRLLMPFVLWSCLVVTFYAVSVAELKQSKPLVAVASVSNFNTARTYRSCFFAQELAAEEDPTKLPARRAVLKKAATMLRDAFYTLKLGSEAWRTLGPNTERFPLVTLGMSYENRALRELFYTNTGCLRSPPNLPCPGPEYRWYQLTHSGVDSIMQVYLNHLFAMAEEVVDVKPGLDNPHLDFIYNVGTKDLTDANIRIGVAHFDHIENLFSNILLLHILLFVLLWFFLAGFFVLLLKPLLVRLAREKRHIAELLSQLPLELDVEKMVRVALAGSTGGPAAAAAAAAAAEGGSGGEAHAGAANVAQQQQLASDAARAWKNVLRTTSNAISQERERRNSLMISNKMLQ
ncbi:hypothetical protein VOLCADRAFT_96265 [Volvox carteri f. nagariensis]|uniref:PAS domain-containing protein n=1 Tax=Volvox carteri f. nagariensis TaxID=3068 RepID=D8U9N3_VOLCA|nr:uncharacterized protein VOLCADRAFT_96265 [Volvox carteri f. nagariensis]EFJ43613.1 hypothetical protein VOLCADRAFT_96265 [Volvox carteri f. nagariensis]|eukprot:XP_002955313.1 hypothetical protein VOLCADRAFT_96265 [Volvox carteri f. nagariensis]